RREGNRRDGAVRGGTLPSSRLAQWREGDGAVLAGLEGEQRLNDAGLGFVGQVEEERQPDQAVADVLRNGTRARDAAEAAAHFRKVQRQIVEDGVDLALFQVQDQVVAILQARHQQVKKV